MTTLARIDNDMPLICELGWHKAEAIPCWNEGYYFTQCARCGRDLVRTAFDRWHLPRGYRVVWRVGPPLNALTAGLEPKDVFEEASAEEAIPIPEPAPTRAPSSESRQEKQNAIDDSSAELSIRLQEVLQLLRQAPSTVEPAAAVDAPAPAPPPADIDHSAAAPARSNAAAELAAPEQPPRSAIPDFMDDWGAGTRETPIADQHPASRGAETLAGPNRATHIPPPSHVLSRWARSERPGPIIGRPRRHPVRAGSPLLLAIPLAVLVGGGWMVLRRVPPAPPPTHWPAAAPAPSLPFPVLASGQSAFVAARALNCRSAPARQADPVRILGRGEPVRIIARDGDWASLTYRRGQCWALVRYLSAQPPIKLSAALGADPRG